MCEHKIQLHACCPIIILGLESVSLEDMIILFYSLRFALNFTICVIRIFHFTLLTQYVKTLHIALTQTVKSLHIALTQIVKTLHFTICGSTPTKRVEG